MGTRDEVEAGWTREERRRFQDLMRGQTFYLHMDIAHDQFNYILPFAISSCTFSFHINFPCLEGAERKRKGREKNVRTHCKNIEREGSETTVVR